MSDDVIDEDSHDWVDDEPGVKACAKCLVRKAVPGLTWQRWKGAHWRKITSEAVPPCGMYPRAKPEES